MGFSVRSAAAPPGPHAEAVAFALCSCHCWSPCFVFKMVSFRLVSFFCFFFVALWVMLFSARPGRPRGCSPAPQLRAEPGARHEGPCAFQLLEKQSLWSGWSSSDAPGPGLVRASCGPTRRHREPPHLRASDSPVHLLCVTRLRLSLRKTSTWCMGQPASEKTVPCRSRRAVGSG